jgi:predicted enzyme related to lactoylglutathione lyase
MFRPIHFEIHSANPETNKKFYEDIFGWRFEKWEGPMEYWVIYTGEKGTPGIDGGMVKRQGDSPKAGAPVTAYVCTMDVPNIDEWLDKVTKAGGQIALPKMAIPGMAWLAYGIDLDGNIFGMFQEDANAK